MLWSETVADDPARADALANTVADSLSERGVRVLRFESIDPFVRLGMLTGVRGLVQSAPRLHHGDLTVFGCEVRLPDGRPRESDGGYRLVATEHRGPHTARVGGTKAEVFINSLKFGEANERLPLIDPKTRFIVGERLGRHETQHYLTDAAFELVQDGEQQILGELFASLRLEPSSGWTQEAAQRAEQITGMKHAGDNPSEALSYGIENIRKPNALGAAAERINTLAFGSGRVWARQYTRAAIDPTPGIS